MVGNLRKPQPDHAARVSKTLITLMILPDVKLELKLNRAPAAPVTFFNPFRCEVSLNPCSIHLHHFCVHGGNLVVE